MQCIFDPKMAKTAKTRIFLDTTLPLNDSKQLSQVSDQVLDKSDERIQRNCQKIRFLDIFFETAHQIFLKLGQNLGTVALNH